MFNISVAMSPDELPFFHEISSLDQEDEIKTTISCTSSGETKQQATGWLVHTCKLHMTIHLYRTVYNQSAAFSKPAGCRLNEPPPLEVWPSLFQTENILFLFCVTDKGKKAKRTPKKKLPENNLKVKKCLFSVPSVFTSRYFKQTSLRSFFGYESGNIHRFYRSIGKNVTFTSSIWLVIGK